MNKKKLLKAAENRENFLIHFNFDAANINSYYLQFKYEKQRELFLLLLFYILVLIFHLYRSLFAIYIAIYGFLLLVSCINIVRKTFRTHSHIRIHVRHTKQLTTWEVACFQSRTHKRIKTKRNKVKKKYRKIKQTRILLAFVVTVQSYLYILQK